MEVNPLNVFHIRNDENTLWIGNPVEQRANLEANSGFIEYKVKDLELEITALGRVIRDNLVADSGNREVLVFCNKTKKHYILNYSSDINDIGLISFYYRLLPHKKIEITKIYLS